MEQFSKCPSNPNTNLSDLLKLYDDEDPAVRYWAIQSQIINGFKNSSAKELFLNALKDENPTVKATAAEGLAKMGLAQTAIPAFKQLLTETEPNLAHYIARCLATSLSDVRPLETEIRAARKQYLSAPGSKRRWKDFVYSAFTCWALEWSLVKSGLNSHDDFH